MDYSEIDVTQKLQSWPLKRGPDEGLSLLLYAVISLGAVLQKFHAVQLQILRSKVINGVFMQETLRVAQSDDVIMMRDVARRDRRDAALQVSFHRSEDLSSLPGLHSVFNGSGTIAWGPTDDTKLYYYIIDYIIIQYADASTPKAIISLEVHGSLSARFHQTQFLTIVKHSCCMSPLLCHVWWPSSLRGSMQTRWRPSLIWRISRETPWLAERNGRTSWQVTWNQRMIQIAPLELKLCENRVLFNVVHWFLWNLLRFQFLKWTIWSMSRTGLYTYIYNYIYNYIYIYIHVY